MAFQCVYLFSFSLTLLLLDAYALRGNFIMLYYTQTRSLEFVRMVFLNSHPLIDK